MKKHLPPIIVLLVVFFYSCTTPQYFHDESSYQRQKELRNCRSGNVLTDVACGIGSVLFAVATESEVNYIPSEQQFTKLKIENPTLKRKAGLYAYLIHSYPLINLNYVALFSFITPFLRINQEI